MTSLRDIEIHGDDLVVATHGRGFWIIDSIGVLRQLDDAAARADAFLYKPGDAIDMIAGGDNGTPLQKDEPQAENPAVGAYIDYYLKSAASRPVTLEILDDGGRTIRIYSSTDAPPPAPAPQTVTVLWNRAPQSLSAAAGLHRFVWDLRRAPAEEAGRGGRGGRGGGGGGFGRGGGPSVAPGSYSAKLTVDGKSYTEPFTVLSDPRRR